MIVNELVEKNINDVKDYVIDLRREFHSKPEPSLKEFNTSRRIKEELEKIGVDYRECATTGVIATIKGNHPGKTVALRGDMDALSVQELNTVEYKSKIDGMMHACGHDGHTAMLLGSAKVLNKLRDEIHGTVKLFFQPAEETAQGAHAMINDGAMEGVDSILGIHLWADIETGKVSVEEGPRMAASDWFKIEVKGKGGHGSAPQQCVDAVLVSSAIVMNLQSIVSREIHPNEPLVLTVGMLNSGSRFNVIAENGYLQGTTRSFNPELRKQLPEIIGRVVENTAKTYRAQASLDFQFVTSPVINDPKCSAIAEKVVKNFLGKEGILKFEKVTGGEDFSHFMELAPGALAFVGCRNEEKNACYPHHSGHFDIDEDALEIGTRLYTQYAIEYLQNS